MTVRPPPTRIIIIPIFWWLLFWLLLGLEIGWCEGQAACPTVAAPAAPDASTCSTHCPDDRVCVGTECLYPCKTTADCEAIGDPRIPVCSPDHVCVGASGQ